MFHLYVRCTDSHCYYCKIQLFQEFLNANHRMRTVEALKLLEVVEPKIVHRHHITLTPWVDALHAPKVHLVVIDIPIHGLKEDVQTMEIVVERRIAEVFLRAVDHHFSGLVVVAEARVVVIERVHPSARNGVRDIETQRHMV